MQTANRITGRIPLLEWRSSRFAVRIRLGRVRTEAAFGDGFISDRISRPPCASEAGHVKLAAGYERIEIEPTDKTANS